MTTASVLEIEIPLVEAEVIRRTPQREEMSAAERSEILRTINWMRNNLIVNLLRMFQQKPTLNEDFRVQLRKKTSDVERIKQLGRSLKNLRSIVENGTNKEMIDAFAETVASVQLAHADGKDSFEDPMLKFRQIMEYFDVFGSIRQKIEFVLPKIRSRI